MKVPTRGCLPFPPAAILHLGTRPHVSWARRDWTVALVAVTSGSGVRPIEITTLPIRHRAVTLKKDRV